MRIITDDAYYREHLLRTTLVELEHPHRVEDIVMRRLREEPRVRAENLVMVILARIKNQREKITTTFTSTTASDYVPSSTPVNKESESFSIMMNSNAVQMTSDCLADKIVK